MNLLLDLNLSPDSVPVLREAGWDAIPPGPHRKTITRPLTRWGVSPLFWGKRVSASRGGFGGEKKSTSR